MDKRAQDILSALLPLNEEHRQECRERADRLTIRKLGSAPQWEHYRHTQIGRYPPALVKLAAVLLLLVLFFAANVSMFRLFSAGRDHYLDSLAKHYLAPGAIEWQGVWVGAAFFLMAEILVVISALARSVFFERGGNIMVFPMAIGVVIAIAGNVVIAQPNEAVNGFWAWLETLAPPIAVLFMSLVGERLALSAIETRYANRLAFEKAQAAWEAKTATPRDSREWFGSYANMLRAALRAHNSSGRGATERRAFMDAMTDIDWAIAVQRELDAESWFTRLEAANFTQALSSSNSGLSMPPSGITEDSAPTESPNPDEPTPVTSKVPLPTQDETPTEEVKVGEQR